MREKRGFLVGGGGGGGKKTNKDFAMCVQLKLILGYSVASLVKSNVFVFQCIMFWVVHFSM